MCEIDFPPNIAGGNHPIQLPPAVHCMPYSMRGATFTFSRRDLLSVGGLCISYRRLCAVLTPLTLTRLPARDVPKPSAVPPRAVRLSNGGHYFHLDYLSLSTNEPPSAAGVDETSHRPYFTMMWRVRAPTHGSAPLDSGNRRRWKASQA